MDKATEKQQEQQKSAGGRSANADGVETCNEFGRGQTGEEEEENNLEEGHEGIVGLNQCPIQHLG